MDKILLFLKANKIIISGVSLALCLAIAVTAIGISNHSKKGDKDTVESLKPSSSSEVVSSEEAVPEVESTVESSSEAVTSSKPVTSKPATTPKPTTPQVTINTNYKYNTNSDINNNVFLDSLVYTGYNINKHRSDGLMWVYILASQKRAKGWLSNIHYGGGCTGYETDSKGLPNISRFERGGLVCASYVTYVYFNYLPNVAGIDTSALAKPDDPHLANSWYKAAQKWVQNGQADYIQYSAGDRGIKADINFSADIPIGSIICFQDYYKRNGHCSHVAVYAGYANGYHWVFHVGNDNGPEFCAIERMNRDPDPQWLLAIISTPKSIRFSASVQVELTDNDGKAISGTEFSLKNPNNGSVIKLGKTDANGKLTYNGLTYGSYKLIETVPDGYTAETEETAINLTTQNNSLNIIKITNTKKSSKTNEEQENDNTDNSTETENSSDDIKQDNTEE